MPLLQDVRNCPGWAALAVRQKTRGLLPPVDWLSRYRCLAATNLFRVICSSP